MCYNFIVNLFANTVGFAAADVEVKSWFPESPNLEFVVNSHISSIIGIRNHGPEGFNVTAVQGNLALVSDPAGNVFNFTGTVRHHGSSDWHENAKSRTRRFLNAGCNAGLSIP